jgi:ribonuclease VapC
MMKKNLVLDSYALLAFFQNEKGSDAVRELISSAERGDANLSMCVINLGEVWYTVARDHSQDVADRYERIIRGMAIDIVDVDWKLTRQAAEYKENGGMSYADCFAAALAKFRNAELVTGDKEFKMIEGEIQISWL